MHRMRFAAATFGFLAGSIGLSGTAHAMLLNAEGTGQVLLYPYYTVNADNATLLTVVNTSYDVKVVQLRFREAYNGQDVFGAQIFLSPYDVWAANVFALGATGGANLLSDDESCTLPDIKGASGPGVAHLPPPDNRSYLPFRAKSYQDDHGPTSIERTREGHFEIIEMATIANGSPIFEAVIHNDGVPAGCNGLAAVVAAHRADMRPPTGGLYGSARVVNPSTGTAVSYNADAIDGFYRAGDNLYDPVFGSTLSDARTTTGSVVATVQLPPPATQTNDVVTAVYPPERAIDAVSALFTADKLTNDYALDAGSGLESEWVLTFPTKRFYVNHLPAIAPFVESFPAHGKSCVVVSYEFLDHDERLGLDPTQCGDFCPPAEPTRLCYETQVLTLQKAASYASAGGVSAVLGSKLTVNLDPRGDFGFTSGWLHLLLAAPLEIHETRVSTDGEVFRGLPVQGFVASNAVNLNNANPDVLSTYSTSSRHRAERICLGYAAPDGSCH
ncbi:MAG: hypothetical protein ABI411_17585 [Tahibacter sp.]